MKGLVIVASSLLTLGLTAACGKADPGAGRGAVAATGAEPAPAPAPANAAPVLVAYDVVREALASDNLDAAKAGASKLADVAKADQPKLATAASQAVEKGANIDAFRTAFGEVSRALLEAIAAKPELGKDLLAFRCPMAEGYQKWVQFSKPMRNPYMGSKMLECGSKADLTP